MRIGGRPEVAARERARTSRPSVGGYGVGADPVKVDPWEVPIIVPVEDRISPATFDATRGHRRA